MHIRCVLCKRVRIGQILFDLKHTNYAYKHNNAKVHEQNTNWHELNYASQFRKSVQGKIQTINTNFKANYN